MSSKQTYHVAKPSTLYSANTPLLWLDLLATPAYAAHLSDMAPAGPPAYIIPAYMETPALTLRYAIAAVTAITYDDRLTLFRPVQQEDALIIRHFQNPEHHSTLPQQLILPALLNAMESLPAYIMPAYKQDTLNPALMYAAFAAAFAGTKSTKSAICTRNIANRKVVRTTYYSYVACAAVNCLNAAITNAAPQCAFRLLADGKIITACNY